MNLEPQIGDFIDIHTHNTEKRPGVFSIRNVFLTDYPDLPAATPLTIGLHPWHISFDSVSHTMDVLHKAASLPEVVGIGETGLDKVVNKDIEMQERIFRLHAGVAERFNKPLIIHCVKAFQEMIQLKHEIKPVAPWIIHGYRGSPELAEELIKHGFYISLNEWVIKNPEKGSLLIKTIPPDRLFLETDEYTGHISEVYKFISEIRREGSDKIKEVILNNYLAVFKKPEVVIF